MSACPICLEQEAELFCTVPDRREESRQWEVWRCPRCGHGWTLPPLLSEEAGAYYPPAYLGDTIRRMEDYQAGTLQRTRSWGNELDKVRLLEAFVPDGGRILDVGCADGSFLLALNRDKWRTTGIEYIGEVVDVVLSHFPELGIEHGTIYKETLQPGSFDVVTLWHVLEHLQDPYRVVERLHKLLRSGGILLIAVPRFDSHQARIFRSSWFALDVPRHQHHFSLRSLGQLLESRGFSVRESLFFSRKTSVHQLKHSLLAWSEKEWGNRLLYYLLKPAALASTFVERWMKHYSALVCVSRRID